MQCLHNWIISNKSVQIDVRMNVWIRMTGTKRFSCVLKYSIAPLKTRLSNGSLKKDLPHWPYAYTYGGRRLHELFLAGKTSLQRFTVWLPNNSIVSSPYCNLLLQPVTITDGKITIWTFRVIPICAQSIRKQPHVTAHYNNNNNGLQVLMT